MEKIMGLDLGSVTCGIAISDLMGLIASPITTVRFESDQYEQCLSLLQPYIKENRIKKVVLGLPKHMNGDVGIRGNISIAFKELLEAQGLQVILWDERLTTVSAQKFLISADVSRKKRKKVIDTMAAQTILQDYLDSNR